MARKHSIKKQTKTKYNSKTGSFSITKTEEHLIIDDSPNYILKAKNNPLPLPKKDTVLVDDASQLFLPDNNLDGEEEEDLMFVGKGKKHIVDFSEEEINLDDEPTLIVRVDDDKFW